MGSLAILKSQSAGANNASDKSLPATALAELNDADYLLEVLQQQQQPKQHSRETLASEMELEQALRTKAEALGIPIRPQTPIRGACGFDANSPLSSHARNPSSGSNDTTDTAPTTVPSSPTKSRNEEPSLPPSPRTRPRCLTFSQYDKYLVQVEPNLNQPKFLKQTSPAADVVPNIFSVTTRKSVVSITNGIKAKVRWKKRASMPHAAIMYAVSQNFDVFRAILSKGRTSMLTSLVPVHVYVVGTISANKPNCKTCHAATRTAATVYEL